MSLKWSNIFSPNRQVSVVVHNVCICFFVVGFSFFFFFSSFSSGDCYWQALKAVAEHCLLGEFGSVLKKCICHVSNFLSVFFKHCCFQGLNQDNHSLILLLSLLSPSGYLERQKQHECWTVIGFATGINASHSRDV